jgi:hypothetical protein
VPESRDTSDVRRKGKMTKDGPRVARWALSIMVDTVIKYNPLVKAYYVSVKERKGSGKKVHVAAMRKLVRIIHRMLKARKPWREDPSLTERKVSRLGGDG